MIWLRKLPAVDLLRRVWLQPFSSDAQGIHWRTEREGFPPSALLLSSPHDPDAHYNRKRQTSWVGYKVYLTETCDEGLPHLITNVETSAAPIADGDLTPVMHQHLQERGLLPETHLADTGFIDAELLVESRKQHGVELVGPTRADYHWQSHSATPFTAMNFQIDWAQQQATCPAGKVSLSWSPAVDKKRKAVIKVKFSGKDCGPCASRSLCTRTKRARRTLTLRPHVQHEALAAARAREQTPEYRALYRQRAGVEGTISQGTRAFGLRRSRYIGELKTHLQHSVTAAAINFVRLADWFAGVPMARTREPAFVRVLRRTAVA